MTIYICLNVFNDNNQFKGLVQEKHIYFWPDCSNNITPAAFQSNVGRPVQRT